MKVLMFTWEFPPLIAGGLGMACYGMVRALLGLGIKVDLVLPTKELVYFPLREPDDVDKLPAVFLDPKKHTEYISHKFLNIEERLDYIGVTVHPETYLQLGEVQKFVKAIKKEYQRESITQEEREIWEELTAHLMGDEDIFKKVQEYTIRAERFARELDFDLIHAHDWLTYPAGMLARSISGKPLVVHIHATEYDRAGGPGNPRVHRIERAGMMFADKVIAVS
ncbi:MAG TPA: glycogen/starch synthase [Candidatus Syntrophosphaera thermopropionivorans]|nr:glycogen/starch synthase [Candidatus Syntrophosphaera thermopropionivorans]